MMGPASTKVSVAFEPLAVMGRRLGAAPEYVIAVRVGSDERPSRFAEEADAQRFADKLSGGLKAVDG